MDNGKAGNKTDVKNELVSELNEVKQAATSIFVFLMRWGVLYIAVTIFAIPFVIISVKVFVAPYIVYNKVLYFFAMMFSVCVFMTLMTQYYLNKKEKIKTHYKKSVIKTNMYDVMFCVFMMITLLLGMH